MLSHREPCRSGAHLYGRRGAGRQIVQRVTGRRFEFGFGCGPKLTDLVDTWGSKFNERRPRGQEREITKRGARRLAYEHVIDSIAICPAC